MPTVCKSVIVDRRARLLFDLVDDVERYPEFLPWCASTTLIERTPERTHARIDIDYHGLKTHVATVNLKQPPESMQLELTEGPFERFTGRWRFTALGPEGCRVEFTLDYHFDNAAVELVLGPVFAHIAATLVDRFVARAGSQP